MKAQLTFIILLVSLFQNVQAQVFIQFRQGDSIVAGAGCSVGFYKYYTFKPKDITSYQFVIGDFGKDNFQAYYGGKPLPQIDPKKATTTFAKEKYAKDSSYYHAMTFITDGNKVYYKNTLMQNADIHNIYFIFDNQTPLYESNSNAYFGGHLLNNVNPATIKLISSDFHKKEILFTDGKHIYRNEVLLTDADANSFRGAGYTARKLVDGIYVDEIVADSRDKNSFYLKGKKVTPYRV